MCALQNVEDGITYLLYSLFTHSVWDCILCFVHPIFRFLSLLETKLWKYKIFCNLCLHFARQDGQDRKKGKKITQRKWPKYRKTKIWDEQNTKIKLAIFKDTYFLNFQFLFKDYIWTSKDQKNIKIWILRSGLLSWVINGWWHRNR